MLYYILYSYFYILIINKNMSQHKKYIIILQTKLDEVN